VENAQIQGSLEKFLVLQQWAEFTSAHTVYKAESFVIICLFG
jgi:hypothetical protein